jgi:hypothetical protein
MNAETDNKEHRHSPILGCKIHKFSKMLSVIKSMISPKAYQTLECFQQTFALQTSPHSEHAAQALNCFGRMT